VNAVYGFTSILLGILEVEKPDYLATAWDMKGPTFRDVIYTEYKATRNKTDDDLIVQFPRVREVLDALSIPVFEKEGLEADDYLGIVSELVEKGHPDVATLIVTGDKDAFQLVRGNTVVVSPVSGYTKVIRYDRQAVKDKMGVWPEQVPDFKGLCGDNSDNIPGVMGIGEKTAVKLLEQFGTVEDIYAHLEEVQPERVRELLRAEQDKAGLYKKVATILREDGLEFDLEQSRVHTFDMDLARKVFSGFSFKTLLGRLEKLNKPWEQQREDEKQWSLF
jgi:DNA polymerase-1